MAQYLDIKAANPGSLLFYRMGDFYELFFGDAEIAARDLGIALTKRGKHLGEDIPMCGVPVHAADGYLQRLIRLGHRVAICEQLEDPSEARKRGSKAVVRRDVVRLITPGTLTEDTLLESRSHNYLAALARVRGSGEIALAWADISSGDLNVMSTRPDRLGADLARLDCREIVVPDSLLDEEPFQGLLGAAGTSVTPLPGARFDSISAERRLAAHFGVSSLDAFASFTKAELSSLGGLVEYITLTQVGQTPYLRPPRREVPGGYLLIDAATRTNLELSRNLSGARDGSLLSIIDMTVTASGARLLAERLSRPLTEPVLITARLDEIDFFLEHSDLRHDIRNNLRRMPDMARALGRLTVGRAGPRDLASIRDGLQSALAIDALIRQREGLGGFPLNIAAACDDIRATDVGLVSQLSAALADDLPSQTREGGFVREGYLTDIDETRRLRDDTRQVIAGLQTQYATETGLKALKIRHNNILGYFIEVSSQQAASLTLPSQDGRFMHRQTVANAMRFVTRELTDLERRIASAADRLMALETDIFEQLAARVTSQRDAIAHCTEAISAIDVATSLAELAQQRRYVRPRLDMSMAFEITGGRHPVVEANLEAKAEGSFVTNDCHLSGKGTRIWLLTGPNMAGKSTFLRQNALLAILAQMGSFVPADSAYIGIVDRLFSRVGAADDLARGRSTFMVEMVETAAILNQATPRSLVILDEIGRGTATFDGLSIAWATIESLHDTNCCRALFATHYHELTALSSRLEQLSNVTVKVREWHGEVVFLHEVIAGVADRSYGIQVAKLAGLPPAVIARASDILEHLEQSEQSSARKSMVDDLPLFSAANSASKKSSLPQQGEIEKRLAAVVPDELSPRQALELLYELKEALPDLQTS
ncbi:MAG: DNA mismatch repair protein MutS [Alphaproteobacteria bacterium]|nr:DNA mismatch repair protein MutS [Alphaproteobacteria bacterium]